MNKKQIINYIKNLITHPGTNESIWCYEEAEEFLQDLLDIGMKLPDDTETK